MRQRLGMLIGEHKPPKFGEILSQGLGIPVGFDSYYGYFWAPFLQQAELRDVLHAVTVLVRNVKPGYYLEDHELRKWLSEKRAEIIREIRRIFSEEGVRYRVDDQGGVHFSIDVEFERMRISTIQSLQTDRYKGVAEAFDGAFVALDKVPPDGKAAVRAVFFSAEGLFRLMFPKATLLGSSELDKHLRPQIDALFAQDRTALSATHKVLTSLREWVLGAHYYRHEPGTEEPVQPPLHLAVVMVSQGAAFIRWLANLDRAIAR